jgi:hypothetical protein
VVMKFLTQVLEQDLPCRGNYKNFIMNQNKPNLCPTCNHEKACVLTSQKESVWACSEYDEHDEIGDLISHILESQKTNKHQIIHA